jgi:hypothetical protein
MRVHGSRALWVFLLAASLVCSLVSVCTAKQIREEFDAAPQIGFEPIADGFATSSFSGGNYILEIRSGTAWGRLHLEGVAEFSAATRIQLSAGTPSQAAGIVFDFQGESNFRVFLVTGDGSCGLLEFDGAAFRNLSGWRKGGTILPAGEWNTLAVTVSDGFARCSVNGREVLAMAHPEGTGGDIGLAAVAWGGGRASFDYLRLCDLGEAHSYSVSIVGMDRVAYAGLGEEFSHYASIDGGPESLMAGEGTVLASGQFSGVRVVPVKIHTVEGVDPQYAVSGYGSVQLVLYSCDPGSQEQTVRIRVCGDRGTGPQCDSAWADWEYVLRVVVD